MPKPPITHRATVFPFQCAWQGMVNARFLANHFDDAAFQIWPAIGCSHARLKKHGVETVSARYAINFLRPLASGDMIEIDSGISRVGNKSVAQRHNMRNSETGELHAIMDCVEVCFDLDTRSSAPMPAPVRAHLQPLVATAENDPLAGKPAIDNTAINDQQVRWKETHRGLAFPWMCDHFGHMNARFYAHHFEDAALQLYPVSDLLFSDLHGEGVTLAMAQCQINYIQELPMGSFFLVRSGFTRVGSRSVQHTHRLEHAETGELHATFDAIDTFVDATTRKPVQIPDKFRRAIPR